MRFNSLTPLLMIIDLQKAIDDSSWGLRNNPNAEEQVGRLLSLWRKKSLPILHLKHMSTDANSKYLPGTPGNKFKDIVLPIDSEDIVEKETNSAFIGTNLHSTLQEKGISEIVIVGVITNNSVESTARMAGNLGYKVIVVSDATFTFNQKDFSGKEHVAEVVHNMSLANLNGEYARIFSTDKVVEYAKELEQAN